VNVAAAPLLGATVPRFAGFSDHAADTGAAFPYASVPTAVYFRDVRARTAVDVGLIVSAATGPGVIVTVCVPLVAPAADAVSMRPPARLSW